jgi:hypothetical protein
MGMVGTKSRNTVSKTFYLLWLIMKVIKA